jgi:hypothetical protein
MLAVRVAYRKSYETCGKIVSDGKDENLRAYMELLQKPLVSLESTRIWFDLGLFHLISRCLFAVSLYVAEIESLCEATGVGGVPIDPKEIVTLLSGFSTQENDHPRLAYNGMGPFTHVSRLIQELDYLVCQRLYIPGRRIY